MDYYIQSRKARADYGRWLHLFNAARALIKSEEAEQARILQEIYPNASSTTTDLFARAMKLWRAGNKWGWPESDRQRAGLNKILARLTQSQAIDALIARHERVLQAGIRANGDIFVITDRECETLPGGIVLPWLTEVTYASPASRHPNPTG